MQPHGKWYPPEGCESGHGGVEKTSEREKKSSNHTPVVGKTKQKEKPTGLEIIKILGYTEKKTTTVARSDQERRFLGDRNS